MARNLCKTTCDFCGEKPTFDEKPRFITRDEAGVYFEEFEGLIVANATCSCCGAKYLAWIDERQRTDQAFRNFSRDYAAARCPDIDKPFVDLSFRSTFDDEPGDTDKPTKPYCDEDFAKLISEVFEKNIFDGCGDYRPVRAQTAATHVLLRALKTVGWDKTWEAFTNRFPDMSHEH